MMDEGATFEPDAKAKALLALSAAGILGACVWIWRSDAGVVRAVVTSVPAVAVAAAAAGWYVSGKDCLPVMTVASGLVVCAGAYGALAAAIAGPFWLAVLEVASSLLWCAAALDSIGGRAPP